MSRTITTVVTAIILLCGVNAHAGEVDPLMVHFKKDGDRWNVSVTLKHSDTGWDHYADGWRVVSFSGEVFGMRTLYHPHVNEQPFTRSLSGIKIPAHVKIVYIEARDNVHGWSKKRIKVDLSKAKGERFKVTK